MSVSKIVAAAASGVGGEALDVDEVFSCHLHTGTGSAQTITNGIDLSGEGGLVWLKNRVDSGGYEHTLYDTARSGTLFSSTTNAASDYSSEIASFNNNGFTTVNSGFTFNNVNGSDYVSWTFRKAPKFFDIVTYTGNGSNYRNISHNLGSVPGHVMVKKTSGGSAAGWINWHRTFSDYQSIFLNTTEAVYSGGSNGGVFGQASGFTSTQFQLGGPDNITYHNENGSTYVAYIFAHNNNDGEFGPDGDQDIIKCGSYTGNASTDGPDVNLGFEPQWVMIKNATSSADWMIFDVMRGIVTGGNDLLLNANDSDAENNLNDFFSVTSTGFKLGTIGYGASDSSGKTYIYMAIRRGPLAVPEDATKVFAMDQGTSADPAFLSGFPVDMGIFKNITNTSTFRISSRLTQGEYLETSETNAAQANTNYVYDYQSGFFSYDYNSSYYSWMWKRAPSFFDVVAYTGTGSAQTISHNLGVVPEMMWVKARSASGEMWFVYHKDLNVNGDNAPETDYLWLNGTHAAADDADAWNDTAPTASVFSVKSGGGTNGSGVTYIAYLFASAPGVSKVGSYTGNGASSQVIDCGFSSGARFVMIKRTDSSNDWYVWDSTRGIVAGNDARLALNNNSAEQSGDDQIDPNSSGFEVVLSGGLNNNGLGPYIFYAIA